MEYFFSNKKEKTTHNKIEEPEYHYTNGKKADSDGHILYHCTYIMFW